MAELDAEVSDSVKVPRELYEWLVEDTLELEAEWRWWHNDDPRYRRAADYADLLRRSKEAVEIRDALRKTQGKV